MQRILLNSGAGISRLGFGTGNLGRLDSKRAALRMLETAYEAGVTHFDTARLYGHGTMEKIVGEFIRGKRGQVTVATKFGLNPWLRTGRLLPLLNAVKFAVKKIPALRQRAVKMARTSAVPTDRREQQYSRARAERSLRESLRELNTDHIDIYLLHEANPELDVSDELLDFLRAKKAAGVIRSFGTGSAYQTICAASAASRAAQDVFQFESDVNAINVRAFGAGGGCSTITHGVYRSLPLLAQAAARHPAIVRRHTDILGADVTAPQNVSRWLLGHALHENPAGGVLVSTIQPGRLLASVRTAETIPDHQELAAFEAYVREVIDAV